MKMKKERVYTGYAVVSRTIMDDKVYKSGHFGISLGYGIDLETCKRYCRKDQIVVRTYRTLLYWRVSIKWLVKYPRFAISDKYDSDKFIQLGHIRFEFNTKYTDGYEREVVYEVQSVEK